MPPESPRLLILGLDSVPPELLYQRFLPQMPTIRRFLERSRYGTLRTIDPPITVPAWAVMFTGVDPGTLGIYGFRHRRAGSYTDQYVPTPRMIRFPTVWDQLSRAGRRVCIIGMPPGYPPPVVNGVYIGDFLTPTSAADFVYPPGLGPEVKSVAGSYEFDVTFRAEDRSRIGRQLIDMTHHRFAVAKHLWKKERWDFFAVHEIGPDRIHHTFWKYFDTTHPRYEAHEEYRTLVEEYYRSLDADIASLLEEVGPDVRVLVASDHGSQAMDGCFCINQWLREQGYLVLKSEPTRVGVPLEETPIDWTRTKAWGAGGYYARIFFNIKGREPQGTIDPKELPSFRDELRRRLATVVRPDGVSLGARAHTPQELYKEVHGDAPDLIAYFGNLRWRSAGTLGHPSLFLDENDTGPDDSVHSFEGVYAVSARPGEATGPAPERSILDVAPTILSWYGLPLPPHLQGKPISDWS